MKHRIVKSYAGIASAVLFGLLASPVLRADMDYNVSVNTPGVTGTGGFLAFDLTGGIPLQDNVATISAFSSDATLGAGSTSGDVTGTLTPGPLVLTADQFFNEWLQPVTFGTTITFNLDVTTDFASGSTPDSFEFFLLDSTQTPLSTSDPSGGNSIFTIDLTGDSTAPDVFLSTAPSSQFTASVTPSTISTPEVTPGPAVGLGLLMLALRLLYKLKEKPGREAENR